MALALALGSSHKLLLPASLGVEAPSQGPSYLIVSIRSTRDPYLMHAAGLSDRYSGAGLSYLR